MYRDSNVIMFSQYTIEKTKTGTFCVSSSDKNSEKICSKEEVEKLAVTEIEKLELERFFNTKMCLEIPEEICWGGFSFAEYYNGEISILKPQLEKLGYKNIRFIMGEKDSYGPLSRIILCEKDSEQIKFVYG